MGYFTPNLRKFSLFIDLKMKSGARKSTWSKEVQSVIQALGRQRRRSATPVRSPSFIHVVRVPVGTCTTVLQVLPCTGTCTTCIKPVPVHTNYVRVPGYTYTPGYTGQDPVSTVQINTMILRFMLFCFFVKKLNFHYSQDICTLYPVQGNYSTCIL